MARVFGAGVPMRLSLTPKKTITSPSSWRSDTSSLIRYIPQTTDNQQPQDNDTTTSAKGLDGKTTPGTPCGYARRVLSRRILLHLPQKRGTTNQVLRHPPQPRVHYLPHTRKRVPHQPDAQSDKTPARRQRQVQGVPWQQEDGVYANHLRKHTG